MSENDSDQSAVDSRTMLSEFRRPFMSRDTEFKVQAGKQDAKAVLCVAYVDARHVQERLNSVCSQFQFNWSNSNREIYEDGKLKAVEATITVGSSTSYREHADVGSLDNVNEVSHGLKALYSDAFKRAAVHFGIAVSLYGLPQMWLPNTSENLKWFKGKARMQKQGEAVLREQLVSYLKDPKTIATYGVPREL